MGEKEDGTLPRRREPKETGREASGGNSKAHGRARRFLVMGTQSTEWSWGGGGGGSRSPGRKCLFGNDFGRLPNKGKKERVPCRGYIKHFQGSTKACKTPRGVKKTISRPKSLDKENLTRTGQTSLTRGEIGWPKASNTLKKLGSIGWAGRWAQNSLGEAKERGKKKLSTRTNKKNLF